MTASSLIMLAEWMHKKTSWKRFKKMNRVQCYAMKALLSHEINGNSIDKLTAANDRLDRYLIGYKEGS